MWEVVPVRDKRICTMASIGSGTRATRMVHGYDVRYSNAIVSAGCEWVEVGTAVTEMMNDTG